MDRAEQVKRRVYSELVDSILDRRRGLINERQRLASAEARIAEIDEELDVIDAELPRIVGENLELTRPGQDRPDEEEREQ